MQKKIVENTFGKKNHVTFVYICFCISALKKVFLFLLYLEFTTSPWPVNKLVGFKRL